MPKEKLTMADYERAAGRLDVPVPTIRTVTAVESGGTSLLNDDRCVIRFEPHIFCRRTGNIYNTLHGDCSFTPRRMGYPTSVDQSWTLFRTATSLNPKAAVMATSWGHSTLLIVIITICFMPFLFLFDEFNFSRDQVSFHEHIDRLLRSCSSFGDE